MKKSLLKVILCLVCITKGTVLNCQYVSFGAERIKVEAGFQFGPVFFLGDLGGHKGKGTYFIKDLNLQFTKLFYGAYLNFYPANWLGIRVAGTIGKLEGADYIIDPKGGLETQRKQRNLDFKTGIKEAYLALEIYPVSFFTRNDFYDRRFQPYILAGAGAFHFNPKGSLINSNGERNWYDLKPLRTEGQGMKEYPHRKEYSLTQLNIPLGGGFKYFLSGKTSIAFETIWRKTFTDYIDDVSTTYIDPSLFDSYLDNTNALIAKKLSYKIMDLNTNLPMPFNNWDNTRGQKRLDTYFTVCLKLGFMLGEGFNLYDKNAEVKKVRCSNNVKL